MAVVLWLLPAYDLLKDPGRLAVYCLKGPDTDSLKHCSLHESQHFSECDLNAFRDGSLILLDQGRSFGDYD